jgi:hypothetical protein
MPSGWRTSHDHQRDCREHPLPDRNFLLRIRNAGLGTVMETVDLEQLEATLRRAMEEDMGEEPQTPKEIAQYKVEMAARDAWLATAELVKLRADPIAHDYFTPKIEADLWSIKNRVDLLISELRAMDTEASNVVGFRR